MIKIDYHFPNTARRSADLKSAASKIASKDRGIADPPV